MNYWAQGTLILLAIIFSNCNLKSENTYSSSIDSLIQVLHKSDTLIINLEREEIKTYNNIIDSTIKSIKTELRDSIIWEDAKLLSKYNRLIKSFKYHSKKTNYLKNELEYSFNQLANLKLDVLNNTISEDSIPIYYSMEVDIVTEIDSLVKSQIQFIDKKITEYKTTNQEILKIIRKLESNNLDSLQGN